MAEAKLNVKLLAHTPNPDITTATAAHLCYATVGIDDLVKKVDKAYAEKLLRRLIKEGHWSVLEHASFTFGIEGVSRALTHQLVRHRIASYCLTGDTKIKGARQKSRGYKKFTLKSLYERTLTPHGKSRLKLIRLNCFDEDKKEFGKGRIKNIIHTGKHSVWEVKLSDGKNIKATINHRFLTKNGWLTLGEIMQSKTELGVNGTTCKSRFFALLRDKAWLYDHYNCRNLMQEEIAEIVGCSKHTVRAWIRKHGLQKETGGLHSHPPHTGHHWKLNRERTPEEKARASERMNGPENHRWKGGITREAISLRREISKELRKSIYERDGFRCKLCQKIGGCLTLHHKIPLYADKSKNTDPNNLVTLCISCHRKVNNNESKYCDLFKINPIPYHSHSEGCFRTIKWEKIESIEPAGIEDTYDVTMEGPLHNFVANGFVVHNSQQSQRYVNAKDFFYIIPPKIRANEKLKKKFEEFMKQSSELYDEMAAVAPKEDARFVLPNAAETKIIMTMNTRSLYNFFERRCCTRAQWEIRILANKMLDEAKKAAPLLFENAGAICERLGYCPEHETCGRYPLKEDALKEVKKG